MTMNEEMIEIRAEFIDYVKTLKEKIKVYEMCINFLEKDEHPELEPWGYGLKK